MDKLYINDRLSKSMKSYCELNGIEDVNEFANRCASQGFNIVRFGTSPKDNVKREHDGIKDIQNEMIKPKKEEKSIDIKKDKKEEEEIQKPIEVKKVTTTRKIKVIKK